jgi:WD40 repeat protein
VKKWDASSGANLLTIQDSSEVNSAALSDDETTLVSANREGILTLWDAMTGM